MLKTFFYVFFCDYHVDMNLSTQWKWIMTNIVVGFGLIMLPFFCLLLFMSISVFLFYSRRIDMRLLQCFTMLNLLPVASFYSNSYVCIYIDTNSLLAVHTCLLYIFAVSSSYSWSFLLFFSHSQWVLLPPPSQKNKK